MREFSVDLTTRLETPPGASRDAAADEAERLLDALEQNPRALGPVAWGHFDPPVLGARFNVRAEDAKLAFTEAQAILDDALRRIGRNDRLDFIEVHVEEQAFDGKAVASTETR